MGHAFAALKAFDAARDGQGHFLVRIEDIDGTRARPDFEAAILEDLRWLGCRWPAPVMRQSERFSIYRAALESLEERALIYPCFCTRRDVAAEIARAGEAPHGPEGPLYPGTCRQLTPEERGRRIASDAPYALRLDSARAAARAGRLSFEESGSGPSGERGTIVVRPQAFGDIVVARKETPASYHLAVVVDDAAQGVTLITRGNDLFSATHVQRLLQALLGLPAPRYAHHRLILDEHGRKFSKRGAAVALRSLRESGVTPDAVRARVFAADR